MSSTQDAVISYLRSRNDPICSEAAAIICHLQDENDMIAMEFEASQQQLAMTVSMYNRRMQQVDELKDEIKRLRGNE